MQASQRRPVPTPDDFELVDSRFVIVPVALWALAAVAVLASTLMTSAPAPQRSAVPAEAVATQIVGA